MSASSPTSVAVCETRPCGAAPVTMNCDQPSFSTSRVCTSWKYLPLEKPPKTTWSEFGLGVDLGLGLGLGLVIGLGLDDAGGLAELRE